MLARDPDSDHAPSPLVYVQNDEFLSLVGEPLPLTAVRRIVIAKWDALYAEAMRLACAQVFAGTPVEICRRGADALASLRSEPADLALLGLTFVDMDGLDLLERIAAERLARRVMVISGRKDAHSLQALRTARFDGFLDPFAETMESLAEALRQVAAGRGFISSSLRHQLLDRPDAGALSQWLTLAELQVFCVVGDGSDDAEAAERLGLRTATVQTHRRNIMHKLGVSTSAKLVREAVRLGVVRITFEGTVIRPGFAKMLADWQAKKAARKNHSARHPAA
jgi:DNA-binding NarL/FixJ family response regulator